MYIPDSDKATIASEKILGYLLNISHPYGINKALFFIRFGFSQSNWKELEEALLIHCQQNKINEIKETEFGLKYIIRGALKTPDRRNPMLISIWFIAYNENIPFCNCLS